MSDRKALRKLCDEARVQPWRAGYKDGSAPDVVMTVAERRHQTKVGIRGESGRIKKGRYVSLIRDDMKPLLTFPPMPDVICVIEDDDLSEAERLAVAKFIAAASEAVPDLLDTLEAVERACKERRFPVDSPPQVGWFVQDILRILEGGER